MERVYDYDPKMVLVRELARVLNSSNKYEIEEYMKVKNLPSFRDMFSYYKEGKYVRYK